MIVIGRILPDITVQTVDDEPFSLPSLAANGRNTLIIVLRHLA
jgi:hypothetical protein